MSANNSSPQSSPAVRPFIAYLSASSLWLAAMTLSSFIGSWLLVDRLEATPAQMGWAGGISRLVPIAFLLAGGVLIDRSNGRSYLLLMHGLIVLPGLVLVALIGTQHLSFSAVVIYMATMAALQALSDPARQAILTRVAPTDVQRSVTLVALTGSIVSYLAISLGGRMDAIGDETMLLIMSGLFVLALGTISYLPSLPSSINTGSDTHSSARLAPREPVWRDLVRGARATWRNNLVRPVIACNFASSMFNAGAYTVAIPFIARTVYSGGSEVFASALAAITLGAGLSSAFLLLLMPFAQPGRIFLYFQLTRAALLIALWANFGEWAFYALMGLWGINMGVTSTLGRSIVQEHAADAERGKVFAFMLLSFMLASAIGAPVLGAIVGASDPLGALLPGVAISVLIFLFGQRTALWDYQQKETL